MAAKLLLPGFGGTYTSEAFTGSATGADTIDASLCAELAFQITSASGVGTIGVSQSFVSGKWSTLVTDLGVVDAAVTLVPITQGPFGVLRFDSAVSSGTVSVTLVGYPLQVRN